MANRYTSDDRSQRDRTQRGYGRQEEQFQSGRGYESDRFNEQMGDGWRGYGDQDSGWQPSRESRFGSERNYGGQSDYTFGGNDRLDNPRYTGGYGPSRVEREREFGGDTRYERTGATNRGYAGPSFDTSDGAGSQLAARHGEWRGGIDGNPSRENRDYRNTWGGGATGHGGFLERAGEAVSSWFSDDDDGRRERGYRGHGPSGYTRSDDRIREDVCDALTEDYAVDARNVQVKVANGEVTLDGTVTSRDQKRRAEDCVERLSGIRHVQNNLRVQESTSWSGTDTTASQSNPTSKQA